MEIRIGQDLEDISVEAARLFVKLSKKYIRASGRFVAALSGGTTPTRLYQILATGRYQNTVDWRRVHIFWVDERFVPADHPDSNFRLIADNLLERTTLSPENIHPIRTVGLSPSRSAKNYEADSRYFFKLPKNDTLPCFDLIILGIGEDGHTASLFPGSKKIGDREHLVVAVRSRKMHHPRITMTLPLLNSARHILFLVSGKSKALVMKKVIVENDRKFPATLVNPLHGICHYFIDKDAGSCLPKTEVKKYASL